MNSTENVTILLLVVTAAVLTTLLVAGYLYNEPAYAAAGSAKSGDYIMVAGQYNQDSDFLYVLDIAAQKLNIYFPNVNTNAITLGDSVDLSKTFRP